LFNREDFKKSGGDVLKVRIGKRIIYLYPEFIDEDTQTIKGYQVNKQGEIVYTKWSHRIEFTVHFRQVADYLSIWAEEI
jgi:hypothetical protein